MIHLKSEYSLRCKWCSEELERDSGPSVASVDDEVEWSSFADNCKILKPVTMAIFETEDPWCAFGFDEEIIKIDEPTLQERIQRITPLVMGNGELHRIKLPNLRTTAFTWDPDLIGKPVEFTELAVTPTFHSCGYHAFFKPSIAEALAQLPDTPGINAFFIDTDRVKVANGAEGHIAPTHWGTI